jgi:hypothetical protein
LFWYPKITGREVGKTFMNHEARWLYYLDAMRAENGLVRCLMVNFSIKILGNLTTEVDPLNKIYIFVLTSESFISQINLPLVRPVYELTIANAVMNLRFP